MILKPLSQLCGKRRTTWQWGESMAINDPFMSDSMYNLIRETELAIIGQLVHDPEYLPFAMQEVQPEDLYFADTRLAYTVLVTLSKQGRDDIDASTAGEYIITHKLDNGNILQPNALLFYIDNMQKVISFSRKSLESNLDRLREAALCRHGMNAMDIFKQRFYQREDDFATIKSGIYGEFAKLGVTVEDDDPMQTRLRVYEELFVNDYTPTKFKTLNKYLGGGFHKSCLYILAARPSMGKTTFAINLLLHLAMQKKKVLFFSLEVSDSVVYYKIAGLKSGTNYVEVKNLLSSGKDYADDSDAQKFLDAFAEADYNLWIRKERELDDICAIARDKSIINNGLDLIVIDHINLMTVKGIESMTERMTAVSGKLKELAMSLNVPVLALSQLNRDLTKRDDKRPMLNDLRGSGSIEQDADVVMFLHRQNYYDMDTLNRVVQDLDVVVAKQRDGITGMINMKYNMKNGRIGEVYSAANEFGGAVVTKKKAVNEVAELFAEG